MTINKEKIKQFKKITRNFILVGTLTTVMLTSPTFMTTAKAVEPYINDNGNYSLNYDGSCLNIIGTIDYSVIDNMTDIKEIFIENATIDSSFKFDNQNLKHIIFRNCNFTNANFESNKNTTRYSFIGCKFDNLDFLENSKQVTRLNFDSCEVGNLDALSNLNNLEVINFYDVGIENIDFLKNKEKLSQLILSNTCVTDLSPIANSNIGFLDVSNTLCIQDLSPVLTLKNLYSFYARNCEMSYTNEIYNFVERNRIESNIEKEDLKIKDEVKNIAKQIINNNMKDEEKIFAIVNYVVDNIEYDHDVLTNDDLCFEYNDNALENALKGIGCCKNFTALTTALMQIAGIKVYEIRSISHIWNLIELEGEYYWIDSTWLDELSDIEILYSSNYMNNNPTFPGHAQLTLPVSMYDDVYGPKIEIEKPNNVIESTTVNNYVDIIETTTLNNNINIIETTTLNNDLDISENTTSDNIDKEDSIEPTTLNNNYVDEEISPNIEVTTQVVIGEKESEQISKNLKVKQASIGAIVGIATALGFAKAVKTKKKNISKSKTK